MCNRLPAHAPGSCPDPIESPVDEFIRMAREAFDAKVAEELKEPLDPRDTELAALRAQLADAAEVMSAMREDLEETLGYAPDYFRDKWDLGSSLKRLDEYKAKYGAK